MATRRVRGALAQMAGFSASSWRVWGHRVITAAPAGAIDPAASFAAVECEKGASSLKKQKPSLKLGM